MFEEKIPIVSVNLHAAEGYFFEITETKKYKIYLKRKNKVRVRTLKLINYPITIVNQETKKAIKIAYSFLGAKYSSFSSVFYCQKKTTS